MKEELLEESMKELLEESMEEKSSEESIRKFFLEVWEKEKEHFKSELHREFEKDIKESKHFILDHHGYLLPFLNNINAKGVCAYATRTFLATGSAFNTLKPIVIELSLPGTHSGMDVSPHDGCLPDSKISSMVVFPEDGLRWEFAKIHVAANDAAYHQLVSHWLHTHAVIEPFIIATRRRLSVMHPIHRLLDPHFKDTLHINALARGMFLNAGGILERTLFTGEFSMWLSSHLYKQWRFENQALPEDLKNRGMAAKAEATQFKAEPAELQSDKIADKKAEEKYKHRATTLPTGEKLILEDYPYAEDGIEIWDAIGKWVREYCNIFYKTNCDFDKDKEIQEWWGEIKKDGHGDRKEEGWYDLKTLEDLIKALTTIIWIASGLHAAVNFGQYAYAGWPPNRPMLLRKFIPEPDTEELEAEDNPEKFIAQMMPEKFQMEFVIAVMDLLSRHTSDEVYLGQRPPENKWDQREDVNKKIEEFRVDGLGKTLENIEQNIKERNKNYQLMNRWGYAKIPYKLLYPDTKAKAPSKDKGKEEKMDITGRGIPNSISI
ncbi:hypothetical protein DITRI_Ditri13aG0123800 [Diplodiscus trichospermus]